MATLSGSAPMRGQESRDGVLGPVDGGSCVSEGRPSRQACGTVCEAGDRKALGGPVASQLSRVPIGCCGQWLLIVTGR